MTYVLFVIKILILTFTLYHFVKNRGVKKPYKKQPDIVFKENPELKEYKNLLGIKNKFDLASLKTAYRKQVKANHPDLFKNKRDKKKATQKMLKINEAYQILSEYLQNKGCLQV